MRKQLLTTIDPVTDNFYIMRKSREYVTYRWVVTSIDLFVVAYSIPDGPITYESCHALVGIKCQNEDEVGQTFINLVNLMIRYYKDNEILWVKGLRKLGGVIAFDDDLRTQKIRFPNLSVITNYNEGIMVSLRVPGQMRLYTDIGTKKMIYRICNKYVILEQIEDGENCQCTVADLNYNAVCRWNTTVLDPQSDNMFSLEVLSRVLDGFKTRYPEKYELVIGITLSRKNYPIRLGDPKLPTGFR